jgi:hypothetical protein
LFKNLGRRYHNAPFVDYATRVASKNPVPV